MTFCCCAVQIWKVNLGSATFFISSDTADVLREFSCFDLELRGDLQVKKDALIKDDICPRRYFFRKFSQ